MFQPHYKYYDMGSTWPTTGRMRSIAVNAERDKLMTPLKNRLSLAKARRDKVLVRDLEKQIVAVNRRFDRGY